MPSNVCILTSCFCIRGMNSCDTVVKLCIPPPLPRTDTLVPSVVLQLCVLGFVSIDTANNSTNRYLLYIMHNI